MLGKNENLIGGNVLMMIPLGFYAPLMWSKIRNFRLALILGILASLGIEITQFIISQIIGVNYRSLDVDDLLLNTLGVFIGYSVFKIVKPLLKSILSSIDHELLKKGHFVNLGR
ncbi:VanZ family protein [Cytobacillus firmus]|uniref:VanZ family protein n=1 Tax=Cytobacillus firmus TaxID=1399 RepID=UPI0036D1CFC1